VARGLEPDGAQDRWIATDNDPQFAVGLPENCRGRWVLMRLDIEPESHWMSCPVLYLDCGTGFSELTAVRLPTPATGRASIDMVFPLPANATGMRFDPLAQPGRFTMGPLRMRPVTKAAAGLRMLLRVVRRIGWQALVKQARSALAPVPTLMRLRAFVQWVVREYRSESAAEVRSYAAWLARFDPQCSGGAAAVHSRVLPRVTVLMAVVEDDPRLPRAIRSLFSQCHADWELCVSVAEGAEHAVRRLLPVGDLRVRYLRQSAFQTSALLNAAAGLATGELALVLSPTDALHPCALRLVAECAAARPDAQVIYTDEDRLIAGGLRAVPLFKPEFNRELLLADWLAVGDLCVFRARLLKALGGFRTEFESEHLFDALLRALELTAPTEIAHIAQVLYHRDEASHAAASDSARVLLRRRAVVSHLERRGDSAHVHVSEECPSVLRVRYALPDPLPLISVIIPTRDRAELLRLCINSLRARSTYPKLELIVVDNNSEEPVSFALFDELKAGAVRVMHDPAPFNFAGLNNRAAKLARGEFLVLMNNDIEILSEDWVEEMLSFAARPDVGAVGARLWFPDETLQHAGVFLGLGGVAGHGHKHLRRGEPGYARRALAHQQLSAVTAAVLMVRRSLYEEVGGMDERLKVAFNDVDFCLRLIDHGYRNIWTPYAEMIHHESASRGAETTPEKLERFAGEIRLMRERWGGLLDRDPAYSPNLTLETEDFGLAWPPRPPAQPVRPSQDKTQVAKILSQSMQTLRQAP
jgi:GT2 family glycosyltransferase